jgi:L-ribulose-5-phosphate 4-epimerase
MLEKLKQEVFEANKILPSSGLVRLTWGNVSGIDRDSGLVVIKPSGINYEKLQVKDLVVVDLNGNVVEGELNPSSDTPTHLYLYRHFKQIGGITHTHSENATSMCQMGLSLPCCGTTHADHFFGTVPLARILTEQEVNQDYEGNTGKIICETFDNSGLNVMEIPAVLLHYHAPFTWGKTAMDSVKNGIALESCCKMYLKGLSCGKVFEMPEHILRKHYERKHGLNATYGQKVNNK